MRSDWQKTRPSLVYGDTSPWRLDVYVMGVLLGLGMLLATPFLGSGTQFESDVRGQMASPWLLPALGFLWVLRCGRIDLSVWVSFALGAAITARITAAGGRPLTALAGVMGCGLAVGTINALLVGWLRLPGWPTTLAVAALLLSAVLALTGGAILNVDMAELAHWPGGDKPLLLTVAFYAIGLLLMIAVEHGEGDGRRRWPVAVALVASGILSALGGLCFLAKNGQTPRPGCLFGDPRVAAAAILAGALLLRGHGGGLLAGGLLPLGLLLSTIWWQMVWDMPGAPAQANVLLLVVLSAGAHLVARSSLTGRQFAGWAATGLTLLGIALLALSASVSTLGARDILHWSGVAVWAAGVLLALARWRKNSQIQRTFRATGA